jgi:hypothetical protein
MNVYEYLYHSKSGADLIDNLASYSVIIEHQNLLKEQKEQEELESFVKVLLNIFKSFIPV